MSQAIAKKKQKKITYFSRGYIETFDRAIPGRSMLSVYIDGKQIMLEDGSKIDSFNNEPLNDKPDYVNITEGGNQTILRGQAIVDPQFGEFYRTVKRNFIGEYANKFKKVIKSGVPADINQTPVSFGGHITVEVTGSDGTRYFAHDRGGDGKTTDFTVTLKGEEYDILYIKADPPSSITRDLIGGLVKFAIDHQGIKKSGKGSKNLDDILMKLYKE